jgi:hypothetical protein
LEGGIRKQKTETIKQNDRETHHLQFLLHIPGDVHRFFPDLLNGEYSALVDADLRVDGGIAEVGIRIRTQRHLTRPYQRLYRLKAGEQEYFEVAILNLSTFHKTCPRAQLMKPRGE